METDLRTALRKLTKQELPFIIEAIVINVDEDTQTCDIRPVSSNPFLNSQTSTIYYDVPYPSVFVPEVNSLCLVGLIDETTPYILNTNKLSKITLGGSSNKDNSTLEDDDLKERELRGLISNRGASIQDGNFRYDLTKSGIVSLNGLYYAWITYDVQSQLELYKNNINLAVNKDGKIYIGKTTEGTTKEFDGIDIKKINSLNEKTDEDPIKSNEEARQLRDILEFLAKRVKAKDTPETFYPLWADFVNKNPSAADFIPVPTEDAEGNDEVLVSPERTTDIKNFIISFFSTYTIAASSLNTTGEITDNLMTRYSTRVNYYGSSLDNNGVRTQIQGIFDEYSDYALEGGTIEIIESKSELKVNVTDITETKNSKKSLTSLTFILKDVNTPNKFEITSENLKSVDEANNPEEEKRDIIDRKFLLSKMQEVLTKLIPFKKAEDRLVNVDYINVKKLYDLIVIKPGTSKKVRTKTGYDKDVDNIMDYISQVDFYMIDPEGVKNIIDNYVNFIKEYEANKTVADIFKRTYPKHFSDWEALVDLSNKGKNKSSKIDITKIAQTQKPNLISINDIFNDLKITLDSFKTDIDSLITELNNLFTGNVAVSGATGTFNYAAFPTQLQTITTSLGDRSTELKDIEDKVNDLFAKELAEINIKDD